MSTSGTTKIKNVALLEPSVAAECVVSEMMGQIRCGTPFLAGALSRQGLSPQVWAEELMEFDAPLMDYLAKNFDAVGLSVALNTIPRGLQVARALKKRRPDLPIIFGGPSSGAFADILLQAGDAVLTGRAETTLPHLLQTWAEDDRTTIPGWVGIANGRLIRNLETPPPAEGETRYDLVHGLGRWTQRAGLFGGPKPALYSLFASTGCVRQCRFCQSPRQYAMRSHDAVIADLERILAIHGTKGQAKIMLVDDCLFGDLPWTKELLRKIAFTTRGHDVALSVQFHVKPILDDELMNLFGEARFSSLAIGFETISQESLDHERKGTTPADNDKAIEQCRRFGIVPYGYFIVGFDTDTEHTVRNVFSYILQKNIVAQVLPVGLMSRDLTGQPTADASRIYSDTSFGATVFVSHAPAKIPASRLQEQINDGYTRITAMRRWPDFHTAYERQFLLGFNRCFAAWEPRMKHHVTILRQLEQGIIRPWVIPVSSAS